MEENKRTLYQQILNDIEEISNSKSQNDCAKLKRKIRIFIKEQKENNEGKVKINSINKIAAELIGLRKQGFENEESINEILQVIAEEYNILGEVGQEKAKEIYKEILGYEGTDCTKMDLDYVREIIYRKIDEIENGEIKPDVINIMADMFESQNPSVIMNMKDYIDIAEDAIIPLIDKENKDLNEKKILTLLKNIVIQYKTQGNYQRALELSRLGSELVQFKGTAEYEELLKELESLELYESLEKNFRTVTIDMQNKTLPEAIRDALAKYNLIDVEKGGGDIFLKGVGKEKEEDSDTSIADKMSVERKLEAIEHLLHEVQKEVPEATIKEIKVDENGTFKGYIIIPIHGTNVTLFENMNEDENAAIYIVDNSQIENIVGKLTKQDAKKLPGVESANHTENTETDKDRFKSYKNRLCSKTKTILEYPQKTMQRKGVVRTSQEWLDRFERAKKRIQK